MESHDLRVLPLFAVGASQGFVKYYIKPTIEKQKASTLAWGTLVAGVVLYDALCPAGETLSEGYDHFLAKNKLLALGAVAITAAHLTNLLPAKYDPIHRLAHGGDY